MTRIRPIKVFRYFQLSGAMVNTVKDERLERAQQVEQLAEREKCDEAREYYAALARDYRKLAEKVETASEETLKKLADGV